VQTKWTSTFVSLTAGCAFCGMLAGSCGSRSGGRPADAPDPATAPVISQPANADAPPKVTEWTDKGVRLKYPADWHAKKNPDFELMLLPPGATSDDRHITVDIPDLPPHLPWMIQMNRIEHDYVQDLRKHHPDLKEESAADAKVPNSKSRLVRSTWHQNGKTFNDDALLIIHSDGVYILDAQTDADHLTPVRAAFDTIQSSLQWTK
jgi:hypothetical protein